MQRQSLIRLQALHRLVSSSLTPTSIVIPLFGHYSLTITVDWKTGKFEFNSEVDIEELCKNLNQEMKNFETAFVETVEKVYYLLYISQY
jgi:hypothetical protein